MSILTIVTATYNRPASLRLAIRSALLQTLRDWRLIVIGDACDDRTAIVIEEFRDERITYINLPVRCGEQAERYEKSEGGEGRGKANGAGQR